MIAILGFGKTFHVVAHPILARVQTVVMYKYFHSSYATRFRGGCLDQCYVPDMMMLKRLNNVNAGLFMYDL